MRQNSWKISSKEPVNASLEEILPAVLSAEAEPPADLFFRITGAISARRLFRARLRIFSFSFLSAASFLVAAFALNESARQFEASGAARIFSLVFSDLGIILANWREFVYSFLEAMPVIPVIATLGGILLLLVSFRLIAKTLPLLEFRPRFRVNY